MRQNLLQTDPKNLQRRMEVILAQARLGQHREAIQMARELRDLAPHHPAKLYSVARAYALCIPALMKDRAPTGAQTHIQQLQRNYADTSVALLREAVANGYRDRWTLEHDPELQSVRNNEGFRRLLNEAKR